MFVSQSSLPSDNQEPSTQQLPRTNVWYHTRASPDYRIMFSKKIYLYFVYKDLICSCAEISSETNDRDYSRFLDVPPVVSIRAVGRGRGDVNLWSLLRLSQVVKKGYGFGQVGGNGGRSGGVDKFSRFAGSYPRHLWSKGGSFCPLQRRGPVRPKTVFEKKRCA